MLKHHQDHDQSGLLLLVIVVSRIWIVPFARNMVFIKNAIGHIVGEIAHCLGHGIDASRSAASAEEIAEVEMRNHWHLCVLYSRCGLTGSLS